MVLMSSSLPDHLGEALASIRETNMTWLQSEPPSVKDGLLVWFSQKLGLGRTQSLIRPLAASQISSYRIQEAPYAAAMGFYIDADCIEGHVEQLPWAESLRSILNREPFTSDRRGIGHNPLVLLGLALLASRVSISMGDSARLKEICCDPRANEVLELRKWVYVQIAAWRLGELVRPCRPEQCILEQPDRALTVLAHALLPVEVSKWLPAIKIEIERDKLLQNVCLDGRKDQSGLEALLIHAAVECLTKQMFCKEADPFGTLHGVLCGFQAAMERWVWDRPDKAHAVRWPIEREDHIQAILFLMLRPLFPDLIYEDPLPKSGTRSTRLDFGIRSLRLGIEVKYIRHVSDFGKIQQEIESDSVGYFANHSLYDRFAVFVYDSSRCTEKHSTLILAAEKLARVERVYVVSAPGKMIE